MTKINPYDLPTTEERNIRIALRNIEWDTNLQERGISLPSSVSVPVNRNLPEEEIISKAIDAASAAWGYCIIDCDVEPIDSDEMSDSTLEYVGDIYTNDL